jgi:hypothetical protein
MSITAYRSIRGLGGYATGSIMPSRKPWIVDDAVAGIEVLRVAYRPMRRYDILYDALTSEATLTAYPEPIGIYTVEQLQAIGNQPGYPRSASYVLMNDIDATDTATWNAGQGFAPLCTTTATSFTGVLDGRGFAIDGLTIARTGYGSLFVHLYGTVKKLHMTNIDNTLSVSGAAIASLCYAPAKIEYCFVSGVVAGGASGSVMAGVAAYNHSGAISHCVSATSVSTGSATTVYLGGIVGHNLSGGTVTECLAYGPVQVKTYSGGAIGFNSGIATRTYYDSTTTGQSDTGKGIPKTTAELKQQAA